MFLFLVLYKTKHGSLCHGSCLLLLSITRILVKGKVVRMVDLEARMHGEPGIKDPASQCLGLSALPRS